MATNEKFLDTDNATLGGDTLVPDVSSSVAHIPRGGLVGRYVVLEEAGSGAMGVVYRAYDPELQRVVALKLLRTTDSTRREAAGEQLRREAQAMARVSHPNVLPVYDVGIHEGQVWIAMEFLATDVLSRWLTIAPRTWREIVAMYSQAGRGLAAAHAVGLVHRDFKPQNVLVGADGRARVLDFGLARAAGGGLAVSGDAADAADAEIPVDGERTAKGAGVGTPRYMAPEQHDGRTLDGRADQFAFCVALFEALYGVRAFSGETAVEVAIQKLQRRLVQIPESSAVPPWVYRVLLRGLEPRPDARFATMEDLLAALADDPSVTRRKAAWWLGGGLVVGLGGLAGAMLLIRPQPCHDADRKLVGVWDEARRGKIRDAILATNAPDASDVEARVSSGVERYAQSWVEAHNAACAATKIYGEQSEELQDARIACLDHARGELAAKLDVLEHADAKVVDESWRVLGSLRPVTECEASRELLALERPPSDVASLEARERIETMVARGAALLVAGRAAESAAALESAVADARALGYRPLLAAALEGLSSALQAAGDLERSRAVALEALGAALASSAIRLAIVVLVDLAYVDGRAADRRTAALEWAALASALNETLGDPKLEVSILSARVVSHADAGEFATAERLAKEAIALYRELDPGGSGLRALLANLGVTLLAQGRYAQSEPYIREALAATEAALGAEHPHTLALAVNVGAVEASTGRVKAALARFEATAAGQVRRLGPEHPETIRTLNNLAAAYRMDGQGARAIALHRRVLELRGRIHGTESLEASQSDYNLAHALLTAGELGDARKHLEHAMAVRRGLLPASHPDLGEGLVLEAELLLAEGEPARALATITVALDQLQGSVEPSHRSVVKAQELRARAVSVLGRPEERSPDTSVSSRSPRRAG